MHVAKQTLLQFSAPTPTAVGGHAADGAARAASAESATEHSAVRPRLSLFPSEVPEPLAEDSLATGESAADDDQLVLPARSQPLWLKLAVVAVAAGASLSVAFAFRPRQEAERAIPAANVVTVAPPSLSASPAAASQAPAAIAALPATASDPGSLSSAPRAVPSAQASHLGSAKSGRSHTAPHSGVKRLGAVEIVDPWGR